MKTDPSADSSSPTEPDITPEEALVLSRIDGQRSVREIAEMSGVDEARAQAIVDDLVRRGVVALGFEDEPPSRPELPAVHEPGRDASRAQSEPAQPTEPPAEPSAEESAADAADDVDAADEERSYRKTFETRFHGLAPDVRAGLASHATDGDLYALCLDPDPRVIAAILTNATFGLQHARLIAFHHRTAAGLDHIASRSDLVRDGLVFRRLIRNPQLAVATLRRIMQPRRLLEIYKASIDHDLPEVSRTGSRGILRTKFTSQAPPEERAELIMTTEARVLQLLSGCTLDARTTQILCGRQVYSPMFIQNVARFGASPPMLLAHLAKLPFVRRNTGLKKALIQHPNMPGDVKRSM